MQIPLFLGKDSSGEALVSDLTKMPHLLIAGTTGSGKSVCINTIIVGILMTKRPDEVKLILVDPKMVEMTAFNTVPHLMCPIVTETQTAVQILEWATVKMDERYALLAEAKVKNIAEFNKLGTEEIIARFNPSTPDEEAKIPKKLPYIVIVIDELADLMMTASKEIEAYIVRLAQKSRAIGIHIILATQRPQATVVTGLIKSNMPCRVAFPRGRPHGQPHHPRPERRRNPPRRGRHALPQARHERSYPGPGHIPRRRGNQAGSSSTSRRWPSRSSIRS